MFQKNIFNRRGGREDTSGKLRQFAAGKSGGGAAFMMNFIAAGGSINPIIGGGTTTVVRALNTATRVNASGLIETVNANLPRFDYDPATGSVAYAALPGATGAYFSTPDTSTASIVGSIDIAAQVTMTDWTPATAAAFVAKDNNAAQRSYLFQAQTGSTGALQFIYSNDGTSIAGRTATSSAATAFVDGTTHWIRVTYNSTTGKVNFYTCPTEDGVTWLLLGVEQTITAGAIFDGTAVVEVGAFGVGTTGTWAGRIYRAKVYNGIAGTLALDFDPLRAATTSATTFVASTGETWTLNGGATWGIAGCALKGLLIEEARTNECLQSRDQTQAAWTKTTMTAALDQTGADGVANSASSLLATAGNATSLQAIVSAANVVRAFSVSVRRLVGTGGIDITIDNGATWTSITSSINAVTYTRVSRVQTLANPTVGFRIQTNADKIAVDFCQEETAVSNSLASSPTTATAGATVTRNVDAISLALGAWYSATEGTIFAEYIISSLANTSPGIVEIGDGTATQRLTIYQASAGPQTFMFCANVVTQVNQAMTGTPTANTIQRAVMNYKLNDFAASNNGTAVVTDVVATIPTVTTLYLGDAGTGSFPLNGWLRKVAYWTPKRDNAQLPAMSL